MRFAVSGFVRLFTRQSVYIMARVWPCGREKAVSHGRSIADTGVKRTHHASVCRERALRAWVVMLSVLLLYCYHNNNLIVVSDRIILTITVQNYYVLRTAGERENISKLVKEKERKIRRGR